MVNYGDSVLVLGRASGREIRVRFPSLDMPALVRGRECGIEWSSCTDPQCARRLGRAVDELKRAVQRFDADSVAVGEDRKGALMRLAHSPDELARRQSSAMLANIARLDALQAQEAEMATAGPFRAHPGLLVRPGSR